MLLFSYPIQSLLLANEYKIKDIKFKFYPPLCSLKNSCFNNVSTEALSKDVINLSFFVCVCSHFIFLFYFHIFRSNKLNFIFAWKNIYCKQKQKIKENYYVLSKILFSYREELLNFKNKICTKNIKMFSQESKKLEFLKR